MYRYQLTRESTYRRPVATEVTSPVEYDIPGNRQSHRTTYVAGILREAVFLPKATEAQFGVYANQARAFGTI